MIINQDNEIEMKVLIVSTRKTDLGQSIVKVITFELILLYSMHWRICGERRALGHVCSFFFGKQIIDWRHPPPKSKKFCIITAMSFVCQIINNKLTAS